MSANRTVSGVHSKVLAIGNIFLGWSAQENELVHFFGLAGLTWGCRFGPIPVKKRRKLWV